MTPQPAPVPRDASAPATPADFVLIAPLPEERDALLARLPGYRKLPPCKDDIRVYYAAQVPAQFSDGRSVSYSAVVLPLAGMGHTQAATATADAIRRFQPRYVLLVGIAGGMANNGVNLGDVLVSDQVADYEQAKVTADGPSIRWQVHQVDQRLLIAAQNHDGAAFADVDIPRPEPGQPRVHFGPICTGDKVIADQSLAEQLREVWIKLIGVEMEAGGVVRAAFQSACRPGFFMVRGVSDLADGDKDSAEVKRWREYACEIAAAWTLDWLGNGPVPAMTLGANQREEVKQLHDTQHGTDPDLNSPNTSQPSQSHHPMTEKLPLDLIQTLAELYPDVRDARALWERAGGRGSEIEANPHPRDLWQRVWTRSIQGAAVRPESLLQAAVDDYPGNLLLARHLKSYRY